ncbi:hypothetical protein [Salinibaculum rarum]|uniref:hypothetical protein n=1 Tax=Salinibaculum rarum TaxID=3058903 RepID=UPI003A9824F5
MTVYISPIGYDSTRITRPILSEGIDKGDQIVLLRPDGEESDKRAAEAIEDVERMVQQIQPDVKVTYVFSPDEFRHYLVTGDQSGRYVPSTRAN